MRRAVKFTSATTLLGGITDPNQTVFRLGVKAGASFERSP
jgi:hypothetical protein